MMASMSEVPADVPGSVPESSPLDDATEGYYCNGDSNPAEESQEADDAKAAAHAPRASADAAGWGTYDMASEVQGGIYDDRTTGVDPSLADSDQNDNNNRDNNNNNDNNKNNEKKKNAQAKDSYFDVSAE